MAEPERLARLREFRLAAHLLLGRKHPVTEALGAAVADPDAIGEALAEVDRLETIPRRRLLATMAVVLPAGPPYQLKKRQDRHKPGETRDRRAE